MGLRQDKWSICFLLLLYFLQGLPLGLTASMVFLLQEHGVSYEGQAVFTIVHYPFAFKFLWAGLVDSFYLERFGRRKSWLFPIQMLLAIFMFYTSSSIQSLLESKSVFAIAILFFCLNFLVATQDICVDGWALTLLSEENAGASANCNAAGQTMGVFVGYGMFMSLYSADFCNKWLRTVPSDKGVVTIEDAVLFYALIFLVVTTFIAIFKKEKDLKSNDKPPSIFTTYKTMLKVIFLEPVKLWLLVLFTTNIGISASGELAMLKMTERGLSRASLALLSSMLSPIKIALPMLAERMTTGRTMLVWYSCRCYMLVSTMVTPILVYYMPKLVMAGRELLVLTTLGVIDEVFSTLEFVSLMSFHAQVSDPILGGVYMTLLNSGANFGGMWPESTVLWVIDKLGDNPIAKNNTLNRTRVLSGDQSLDDFMVWDPYYSLSMVTIIFGIGWLVFFRKKLFRLEKLPKNVWRVKLDNHRTHAYKELNERDSDIE